MDMPWMTIAESTDQQNESSRDAWQPGEMYWCGTDILLNRSSEWTGGEAILLDRRPRTGCTEFRHRPRRHAIMLHLEGANSRTVFRYDGGAAIAAGGTLGRVMLIPASHELEGWSDYPGKIRHIVVLLDPSLVAAESRDSNDGRAFELPFRSDLDDGIIASRLRALQAELENPGLLGRLYIDSLSCEIATRLIRVHAASTARRHHGGLSPRRLRQVKDYIAENLADDITLSDIASVAGVSSGHFCRAFRRSTGVRSHFYIVRQRIERAKSLLTANDMPLAQIAVACGFGDQSHFTACFRRAVGTTPGRFRRDA
jgi:AraC family transcriptional regulator